MDRTVLRIDTGMSWMRFLRGRGEVTRVGMLRALYWSALYRVALLDLESLAARLVADLSGDSEDEMIEKCRTWHELAVGHHVAPAARRAIDAHRESGDVIVLLTGSTQYAACVVADSLDIEHVLCSRLEVSGGRFTGRMAQLCFGDYKVFLAESFAGQQGVDLNDSWFYSDSYNDLPMLRRVGRAVAVNPDPRLRRHASRAGWRIENWDA